MPNRTIFHISGIYNNTQPDYLETEGSNLHQYYFHESIFVPVIGTSLTPSTTVALWQHQPKFKMDIHTIEI